MKKKEDKSLTAVELFAGAGGLMLGLEAAGFETVVANEVHADPCKTLRRNFPDVQVIQGSIRDTDARGLFEIAGSGKTEIGKVDLVAGGPPCQGFSTAGLKDPADPRNTLIGDYIRLVDEIQPRFFLLENVTGLLSLHDGQLFENLLSMLDELDYDFHYRVLHAADYGIPQMRKRLVILGARNESPPEFPEATHGPGQSESGSLFDSILLPHVTCGDAIGDLPEVGSGEICVEYEVGPMSGYQERMREGSTLLFNHQASNHRAVTTAYYRLVPPGGTWLDIPPELRKRKQGIQRWPLDGLARTVTSEPTDFLHPTLDRIPTIRELARIQSFPDRFEFMGQRTTGNKMRRLGYCAQSQQVGNAVPPLLAEAIGRSVAAAAVDEELMAA